jgi:hypothetical protein
MDAQWLGVQIDVDYTPIPLRLSVSRKREYLVKHSAKLAPIEKFI